MDVSVLVPWRPDGDRRDEIWSELIDMFPENWEIVMADANTKLPYRGRSLNMAAREADGDVFVIHNADTYIDNHFLERAVERAHETGRLVYAIDHLLYEARQGPGWIWADPTAPVAITRAAWELSGGFDGLVRFFEAEIFEFVCAAVLGPSVRLGGMGRHAWHPSQDKDGYEDGQYRLDAYRETEGDVERIRILQLA